MGLRSPAIVTATGKGRKVKQATPVLHENLPIVEVADKVLLDTLLADARTAQYILTRLSDRVAVVAPGQFDLLLARLRKQGHTPRVLQE